MGTNYNPQIVTTGLTACFDPANLKSYPRSGSIVIDMSGKGNNANSSSMPAFSSNNSGCFSFNGNQFALQPTNYFGSLDQS
jgi:hypothetical protein